MAWSSVGHHALNAHTQIYQAKSVYTLKIPRHYIPPFHCRFDHSNKKWPSDQWVRGNKTDKAKIKDSTTDVQKCGGGLPLFVLLLNWFFLSWDLRYWSLKLMLWNLYIYTILKRRVWEVFREISRMLRIFR